MFLYIDVFILFLLEWNLNHNLFLSPFLPKICHIFNITCEIMMRSQLLEGLECESKLETTKE
jgi:hypothetical protein